MEETTAGAAPVVIEFDAKAVAPLALFVSKLDVRYYLMGLCVMPAPSGSGCIIVGCDGHRLAMWHDASGKCREQKVFKISPAFVAACKKRSKGGLSRRVKFEDGRLVVFEGIDSEVFIQAGKAEIEVAKTPNCNGYPDVLRVVPDHKKLVPGLRGYINTDYVKQIGEAGNLLGNKFAGVSFYSSDEKGIGATMARFDGAENFIVITMPMRGNDDFPLKKPLPDCFIRPEATKSMPATASYPTGSMGEEVAA